jgi:uncharacterized protein involved in type VI secretion and phage assembly
MASIETRFLPHETMSLRLVDGKYPDLKPYEIVLEEGFSTLYKATLTVLTKTPHTHEDLVKDLLDQKASVILMQLLDKRADFRRRYLHGIVTCVETCGGFSSGAEGACYRYRLTLEPELSRLRFTRIASQPFYKTTPFDIIEKIADKHHLSVSLPERLLDKGAYCTSSMFEQSGSSDLDFLFDILGMYGISFSFVHRACAYEALGQTDLVFSEGKTMPVTDIAYSDGRALPSIEQFDFLHLEDGAINLWKMDSWRMRSAIGVDGIRLVGNDGWKEGATKDGSRCVAFAGMFHPYDKGTDGAAIDDDIGQILKARYQALQLAKTAWSGEAGNLLLRPGCVLELKHYYGPADEKNTIVTQVCSSRLVLRTLWPADMALPPENEGDAEAVEVKALCMDYGKDAADKRFVALEGS